MNLKLIRNAVSVFTLLDERTPPKVVFTTQRDNRVDDLHQNIALQCLIDLCVDIFS